MACTPSPIARKTLTVLIVGWLWLFTAWAAALAGDISGQVIILDKDGQPLSRGDNAVVWVEGIETPPPAEPAVIDQANKEFVPRLLPVVQGQEIRFLNSDKVQHNVLSTHEKEPFDLGLYPAGEFKSIKLYAPRRHKIYCSLHKNMVADIMVLPSHYFSRTDEKGRYLIQGLPPGDYVLRVWHIFGGADKKPIRVDSQPLQFEFSIRSLQSNQESMKRPDKSGQNYKFPGNEGY